MPNRGVQFLTKEVKRRKIITIIQFGSAIYNLLDRKVITKQNIRVV